MHTRCVVSCLLLGPRYQEAAHTRTPPQWGRLVPQLVAVLAAAFGLAVLLLRQGGPKASGAKTVSSAATLLLMLHFLSEGARNTFSAVMVRRRGPAGERPRAPQPGDASKPAVLARSGCSPHR